MTLTPPPRRSVPPPPRPAAPRRRGNARAVLIGLAVGVVALALGGLVFTLTDDDEPAGSEAAPPEETSSPETWRLGYEGFGPIKLGMTLDEASLATGRAVTEYETCPGAANVDGL